MTTQNLWDAAKAVLKLLELISEFSKVAGYKINLQLKKLEKEEQKNPKQN